MTMSNKVALVTGASRGIGKAIASEMMELGVQVIGTATSESGAENISEYLGKGGRGMVLDVSDPESINGVIKEIQGAEGPPQILINNAGITRDNLLMRMKDDEWDDILSTNLSSIYLLSKACLRGMMKARWGRIINITSVVGVTGNPGQANYAAAKAGIIGFTKSLAKEVGSRGITVNSVAPGFIETDMTRALDEKQRDALVAQIPLARLGAPEDIAKAVAYLASDAGGYVTGETLHVNGGMHMA
ncbi:MAG: 3-oxoacyl-ACP reductase FabG [Pseudomonadota bacterium]